MAEAHPNTRLETFCDGVFAIALTLLVIDIKVPPSGGIETNSDLWRAVGRIGPAIFAFVLSFAVIFITWVNHHRFFRWVNKSSGALIYANGLLLLTVVFLPFPTALVGEYLMTEHAGPAVCLYNAVAAVQAVSWILVSEAALRLGKDEKSVALIRDNRRNGYFALGVYSLLALLAAWFPLAIAVVTTMLWAYWLTLSLRAE